MDRNNFVEGIKYGLGFLLVLGVVFGLVYAAGFHYPSEIVPGVFQSGNYSFNGSVYTNEICDQTGSNCYDLNNKMPGSVYFRTEMSVAQSVPYAIWEIIKFNSEVVDTDNSYNPVNGYFTIPVSGFYHFDSSIYIVSTDAGQIGIMIYSPEKGYVCLGGQDASSLTVANDRLSCSGSTYFDAGDVVYVRGYHEAGTSRDTGVGSYVNFGGFLVSQ